MTGTATQTRTPADVASWGTWKDHGNAAVLGYMGRDRKSAGMAVRVVTVKMEGSALVLRSTKDNEVVSRMGPAGRFWAITVPTQNAKAVLANEVPQPRETEDAKAIVRAARPGRNAKLSGCRCGCGAQVKGLYKQGHDARHAGDVARQAIAKLIADPDTNLADMSDLVAELPTEALQAKALKMIASRVK